MKTRALAAEMRAAVSNVSETDRRQLHDLGIQPPIVDIFQMVGVERVRRNGNFYEPDPGGLAAYITPVLVHHIDTPETPAPEVFACLGRLVDLLAWDPRIPGKWALRTGAASWLGCIPPQYLHPDPVRIWRSPLGWLQNGLDGLVILAREQAEIYHLLSGCGRDIIAENAEHARDLQLALHRPWPSPMVRVLADDCRVRRAA